MREWLIILGGGMRMQFPLTPGHVHRCPVCYEARRCDVNGCSWEPDQDLDDDTPAGAIATCDRCAVSKRCRDA